MTDTTDPTATEQSVRARRPNPPQVHGHPTSSRVGLTLAALGVVFGDIGTSPLYTLKTVLALAGGRADPEVVLGLISLLVWTLVVVTAVKYVGVAMRIDNDGEGGILALMSLVTTGRHRPVLVAAGLLGAALIYGDGAITPAISVLSALEGLKIATGAVDPYVLPVAVAILVGLFAVQPLGTERIGKAFGPIMAAWFAVLTALGLGGIARNPGVLAALDPSHAVRFLQHGGGTAFVVLGGIFLCVTGAEALYADMGHFGPAPIRIGWFGLVFPALVINYAGQGALLLDGAAPGDNIFFALCPGPLVVPLVILATLATIIASQAIVTGAFSMTRQAIQLGWLPRLAVTQTSAEGYGQIYVGVVNWLLMAVTVGIALWFRRSDNLASAYGIAVSLTMAFTTVLLFVAMHEVLGWSRGVAALVAGLFAVVDVAFVAANAVKILDGGYVPLLAAAVVFAVMRLWHKGSTALVARLDEDPVSVSRLRERLADGTLPRVPGSAVFLARTSGDIPPVLSWHVRHNRALHQHVLLLTVKVADTPFVAPADRLDLHKTEPGLFQATATFGFMDDIDVPALLPAAVDSGCGLQLEDVTFYVGHVTVVPRSEGNGLWRWEEALFAAMERNALHIGDLLRLPRDRTVELGRQIAL